MPGPDAGKEKRSRPLLATAAILAAALLALPPAAGAVGAAPTPNDELFPQQWNLEAIGIPRAWDVSTGDGVVVAVVDTGVAYADNGPFRRAPDLAGTRFVPGWDFVEVDDHPDDVPVAGKGTHGSHVAGIIAQTTNNGIGAAGIAPGAAIMPIRVLAPDESGSGQAVAAGLRFAADRGARVASVNLGTTAAVPAVGEAVTYAVEKGVTVVVAWGEEAGIFAVPETAYPEALLVGALAYDKARAVYSYYGPGIDLVAPGGDAVVDQNRDGIDDGIVAQAVHERPDSFCFCLQQGASSAAAHVAGVAALVLAAGRATTPAEVREVLTSTAADLGPPGPDEEYGAGLVQAPRALGLPPPPGGLEPGITSSTTVPPAIAGSQGVENPDARALFGQPTEGSDGSGLGGWLRRRRAELAGLGAFVLLTGVVTLVRRRRDRRRSAVGG